LLAKETPKIFGNGGKTRDYVYVTDVAQANLRALEQGDGQIFNIAFGLPTTDDEIFAAVCKALDIPRFKPTYTAKRPGEIDHCYLKIDRAKQHLNWTPRISLAEGLQITANFFREHAARTAGV
jgi:UDP-glucose 4-epimerase